MASCIERKHIYISKYNLHHAVRMLAKCTRLEHWSTDGYMTGVRTVALQRVVEVACINATYIITSPEWESGDVRDSYLQRGFGTTLEPVVAL